MTHEKIVNCWQYKNGDTFTLASIASNAKIPIEDALPVLRDLYERGLVTREGNQYRAVRPGALLLRKRWDKHLRIEVFA